MGCLALLKEVAEPWARHVWLWGATLTKARRPIKTLEKQGQDAAASREFVLMVTCPRSREVRPMVIAPHTGRNGGDRAKERAQGDTAGW